MDADIVRRAQHGDAEAFGILALAAGDRLYAVAHRVLRDTHLAEDATQQALLAIWQDLPHLRDLARFDAWSYRVLLRICLAERRRAAPWRPNLHVLRDPTADGPDEAGLVADRDQLERGFRRLSTTHRAVVVLRHYVGMTPEEMAEILDVPVGTVRSRLRYAMAALRAALEADARPGAREATR